MCVNQLLKIFISKSSLLFAANYCSSRTFEETVHSCSERQHLRVGLQGQTSRSEEIHLNMAHRLGQSLWVTFVESHSFVNRKNMTGMLSQKQTEERLLSDMGMNFISFCKDI